MHLPHARVTRHDFLERQGRADRVLVVVFLRGGADGLTLVPPTGDDVYYRARPVLAVPRADAIDLDGYFALHPRLEPLLRHYREGRLAIIHGAGTEDHTRSHFEAQDTMEHGGVETGSGWLGRYLRARGPSRSALSAVAIGTTRPESLRGAPGGAVMQSIHDFTIGGEDPDLVDRLARLYAAETGPLGLAGRDTLDAVRKLRALRAEGGAPEHGAAYPDSQFGRGLREIAMLIKADLGLLATTIDHPGPGNWDTHFVQLNLIGSLMSDLARGLDAFLRDLGGHRERVTIVAMTEFGRRLKENTSFGTDHGAGSVMFVLGEDEQSLGTGGTVRSGWPDLGEANLDEVGDVPAAINYREVLGPILRRQRPGIDLERVFPGYDEARAAGARAG